MVVAVPVWGVPVDDLDESADPGHCAADVLAVVAAMPPGPVALTVLSAIDPESLEAGDRIAVLREWEQQHAWLSASMQPAMVAAAGPEALTGDDWPQEEVAAAIKLSGRAAQQRIHVARTLTETLPATYAALAAGDISYRHALVMVDECAKFDRDTASAIETRVLPRASAQTVAEFRRSIRRAVVAATPADVEAAHHEAVAERSVRFVPEPDGMASVVATLPAADARMVFNAIDALAHGRHAAAGGRRRDEGVDARRADALVAMASAALAFRSLSSPQASRVELQVVVDLPTLLGLAERPAELGGYGPIPASLARDLATDANWRRLVTEPVTGSLLDFGRRTYRPPQALAKYVANRDRRCSFPGCGQPAIRCDIDHVEPFGKGGKTSASNTVLLCRRHHRMKTFARWQLSRAPDGALTWKSPSGVEYKVRPRDQLDP